METATVYTTDPTTGFYSVQQTLADIRKDVGDAKVEACKTECAIQAAIQVANNANEINFRSLDGKICETEKSAIVFAKDSIIEALRIESRVSNRITDLERNVDTQFCDVKSSIEKVNTHLTHQLDKGFAASILETERKFAHMREEDLEEKLEACRRDSAAALQNANLGAQFSIMNSTIASLVQQTQHLSNKVVQFGVGNVAVPTATNNQA